LLSQGKDGNKAGRDKGKQETVNLGAREYNSNPRPANKNQEDYIRPRSGHNYSEF